MKLQPVQTARYAALFSAFMASGGNPIVPREVWVVLTILLCLYLSGWKLRVDRHLRLVYAWVILTLVLVTFIQPMPPVSSVLSRLMVFISAVLVLQVYLKAGTAQLYEDLFAILRLMAIQAILTPLLGTLLPQIFMIVNVNGVAYHSLAFIFNFHYVHDEIAQYVRANGFFYEPGVFQFFLSIFLYLCLFWKVSVKWSLIACLAILSTWSTIGFGVIGLLVPIAMVTTMRQRRGQTLIISMLLIILAAPVVVKMARDNVSDKLTGELSGSFLARQYDLYTGINIIQDKTLTGIGFSVERYLSYSRINGFAGSELRQEQTDERPNTNGIIQVLYTIGVPLGFPLLLGIFTQTLFRNRIAMAVVMGMSLYSQPLAFATFPLAILLSGMILKTRAYPRRTVPT